MPQQSYPYAIARVRSREGGLLQRGDLMRMLEAKDDAAALDILLSADYGHDAEHEDNLESLILSELRQARDFVLEITPEPEITGLLFINSDVQNMKLLYKARALGKEVDQSLERSGLFPNDVLQQCVETSSYHALPDSLAKSLMELEHQMRHGFDARALSGGVERAFFDYAQSVLKEHRSEEIQAYFAARADFTNSKSAVRAVPLHWSEKELSQMLISGGEIPLDRFPELLDTPMEQWSGLLNRGRFGGDISKVLQRYPSTDAAPFIESAMEKAQMKIVQGGRMQTAGLGPVLGYWMGRVAEAKALRLVFAARTLKQKIDLPPLYTD